MWVWLPVYFYKRNDTFYFSRSIPSDLQHRFKKRKIEVSLRTKSETKAAKSAAALSDRLERYWDSLQMEMIYSRELGLRVTPDAKTTTSAKSFSITEALALYHRLKGGGFMPGHRRFVGTVRANLKNDPEFELVRLSDGNAVRRRSLV